jgi:tripartite-type tricarboxylate transporter receptor subunit TctC
MKGHPSRFVALSLLAVVMTASTVAHAGDYPNKPVMIIMPSPAGGGPDVIARVVADRLTQAWDQQVLVVNRPGAGGLIAAPDLYPWNM